MMGLQSDEEKNQAQEIQKKEIAKAYGKYVKAFTVSERAAGARGV